MSIMQVQFPVNIEIELPPNFNTLPMAVQGEIQARMRWAMGSLLYDVLPYSYVGEDALPMDFKQGQFVPQATTVGIYCHWLEDDPDDPYYTNTLILPDPARPHSGYVVHTYWSMDGCSGFPVMVEPDGSYGFAT